MRYAATTRARRGAAWFHDYLLGWVKEPKELTYLTCLGYALLACLTGLTAFLIPPASISSQIGPKVTTIWGGMILLGGALAIAGALPGWWWLERAGILALAGGLSVYAMVVLTMHIEGTGNRLPQIGTILFCLIFLTIRWLRVRGAFSDPAGGVSDGGLRAAEPR